MSEPLKKQNQTPESHTPKDVPEIIALARQESQPLQGLTENVLRGVPRMGYGDPSPVCYIGSVMRLMEHIGDPVGQSELFALSGAGLCFPWAYQSSCDEVSVIPEIPRRTFAALGYESEYHYEPDISGERMYSKEFYIEKIKSSIDNGRPVLGFGLTKDAFTCLITGYYDHGNGLYLRAYWSPEGTPEGCDEQKYYSIDNWYDKCHGIVTVGRKTGERLAGGKVYAHLREMAAIFSTVHSVPSEGKTIHTGPAAFDAMTAWLLDDSHWQDKTMPDQGVFLNPCGILLLMYYRNSLYEVLTELAKDCPGLVNPAVLSAVERMRPLVPGKQRRDYYLHQAVYRKLRKFSSMRKRELREKVAACVGQLKELDGEIFDGLLKNT